jgi:hypothetical protein
MVAGLPFGKATDMFLPLAIRGAVFIFFTGMLFYGYKEERFVILNLCRYSNISHENCDDTDDVAEVLPAATLDIMKGMAFEFIFGFTFTFRPRHMRFELFGFIPPSIPGEMYQAHKWEKVKNQRGKMEYQTTWKKPWAYGKNKEKGLVNWMEIRPGAALARFSAACHSSLVVMAGSAFNLYFCECLGDECSRKEEGCGTSARVVPPSWGVCEGTEQEEKQCARERSGSSDGEWHMCRHHHCQSISF